MHEFKIGTIESISLILIVIINHIILNLPKGILSTTSSAAPINVIFISIIAILITFFITKLFEKFPNLDILDIADFLGGKFLKFTLGILFLIYFIGIASILLRSFCEGIKIIYIQRTPISYLIGIFIIAIVILNKIGFKPMVRSNLLIIPIIFFSIIFIFVANIKNFTIQNIFPILGYGFVPTFLSGISNMFAFGGIAYLYFIPPMVEPKNFKKISIISISISSIFLLLSITSLLFLFSFISTTEDVMSLYLASRHIEFSRFFQRLDAIFLLIWILSITSYLGIITSFSMHILKKITNLSDSKPLVYSFACIIFSVSLLPKDLVQIRFLENEIYKYIVLGLTFGISIIILILANLKYKRHLKKEGDVLSE